MTRFRVAAIVLCLGAFPVEAQAITYQRYSNAQIIDESDVVIRARVVSVVSPREAGQLDQPAVSVATVEVQESFKGDLAKSSQIGIVYWSHHGKRKDLWFSPDKYEMGQSLMLALKPRRESYRQGYHAPPAADSARWTCPWRGYYDRQLQSAEFLSAARIHHAPETGLVSQEKGARLAAIFWLSRKRPDGPSAKLIQAIREDLRSNDKDLIQNALDATGRLKLASLVPQALQLVRTGYVWGSGWSFPVANMLTEIGEPAIGPLIEEARANPDYHMIYLNCMGQINHHLRADNKELDDYLLRVVRNPVSSVDEINVAVKGMKVQSIIAHSADIIHACGRLDFRPGTGAPGEAARLLAMHKPAALWDVVDHGEETAAQRAAWALYAKVSSDESIPKNERRALYELEKRYRLERKESPRVYLPRLIRKYYPRPAP